MMPAESAHDTVAALGHVGLLQFKDLNTDKSAFQKSYSTQVQAALISSCRYVSVANRPMIATCLYRSRGVMRWQGS